MGRSGQTRGAAATPQRAEPTATVKLTAATAETAVDVLGHHINYLDDYGESDYSKSWSDALQELCQQAIGRAESQRIAPEDAYLIFSAIDRERDYMEDYGANDYTPAELKRKGEKLTRLAVALRGKACTADEFFAQAGAGECDNCGKTAILDRHQELCPECVDSEGEKCVFCGVRYPAHEFVDGLRCEHCREEDEKHLCANCGAEFDEAGSLVLCPDCRED